MRDGLLYGLMVLLAVLLSVVACGSLARIAAGQCLPPNTPTPTVEAGR